MLSPKDTLYVASIIQIFESTETEEEALQNPEKLLAYHDCKNLLELIRNYISKQNLPKTMRKKVFFLLAESYAYYEEIQNLTKKFNVTDIVVCGRKKNGKDEYSTKTYDYCLNNTECALMFLKPELLEQKFLGVEDVGNDGKTTSSSSSGAGSSSNEQ
eukprot:TRINITY_DN2415_c0_g3_i4.p2 TRINITY_DN2415_c0_g3~~TRINITY_DN2415_c0_g3_i4.p2  ORF type:complete len:158 (+),score=62.46 TRINITY_DN2415_c0_g3_i4:290-763(+)